MTIDGRCYLSARIVRQPVRSTGRGQEPLGGGCVETEINDCTLSKKIAASCAKKASAIDAVACYLYIENNMDQLADTGPVEAIIAASSNEQNSFFIIVPLNEKK